MAAPRGLYLFVTFCCRQDGGATWSTSVCHIILQARWRRHVVYICLSHNIAGKMAAPRGLYLFVTYFAGKMAAPRGLYLFVTYCFRQDGGVTWSAFVCHILLQARWRRLVVCICLSHIVAGRMAAASGLYLFVTYCCRQDGGATWSVFVCYICL
jgi:hypothetical protein